MSDNERPRKVYVSVKDRLIQTALMYWACNCHPTEREWRLLSEVAFENNYRDLAKIIPEGL